MGLLKRAHISGMAHYLTSEGIVAWPTKQAEEAAVDMVADQFPDEEIPEGTDETGLTEEQAEAALEQLVEVAEAINDKVASAGGQIDVELNKQAAALSMEDAAAYHAVRCIEKVAAEKQASNPAAGGGPDVPGETTPTPELGATSEAKVDAVDTPSADLVVPQGTTEVDTKPGAVGKEEDQPAGQPGAQASTPVSEASKLASADLKTILQTLSQADPGALDKLAAAADGASLSGGTTQGKAPTPRKDLDDNLNIPGAVASGTGQTSMEFPAAATIGVTKKQPAGTPGATAPTPNNPSKDAYKQAADALRSTEEGRNFLDAIVKEAANAKEATVSNALHALANLGN